MADVIIVDYNLRLNITPSVRNFDDLYRYLLSNHGKPNFLYFYSNEHNSEIFDTIGKLASIKGDYNWSQWKSMGVISFSMKHMLVTWGRKTYKEQLKTRQLNLILEH